MIVEQQHLMDMIGRPDVRFRVPLYQRVYAWTQRQCEEYWTDVERAGGEGCDHFIGTVLFGEDEGGESAGCQMVDLIDGQQRFATTTLFLVALRDRLLEMDTAIDDMDAARLDETYLLVQGDAKLVLSRADQPTLDAILQGTDLPEEDELSSNLVANYTFFKDRLTDSAVMEAAWRGLCRLVVISAQLETEDAPQAVFESLNSKGMALSPADLIRNLLLAQFGYEDQKRLFAEYWEPIEAMFPEGEDIPDLYVDAALHAWLEEHAPNLEVQDKTEIYSAFKTYMRQHPERALEDLLRDLNGFCAAFSQNMGTPDAKRHLDWVQGKLTGLVSERKLFGD